jgi:hypothetical protein
VDLTTWLMIGAVAVGLILIGWAILAPRKGGTAVPGRRTADDFADVGELLRSAYDHARRQETFAVDRRLESVKTYLASQAVGLPVPDETPEPPAKPRTQRKPSTKTTTTRKTTTQRKPKA